MRLDLQTLSMYDVLDSSSTYTVDQLRQFLDLELKTSKDKLVNNYKNINFENYISFHVVIDKEKKVLGFSGLQKSPFPEGHSRVLSRLYYSQHFRANGFHSFPSLATMLMLPEQMRRGKLSQQSHLFISLQSNLKRKKFASQYAHVLKSLRPEEDWQLLQGLYNTCPMSGEGYTNHPSCWQYIILSGERKSDFKLYKDLVNEV